MSLLHVIKYEGITRPWSTSIPSRIFTRCSQLVVHQSQKALLMLQGQALDLFEPGTYTCIPAISRC